MDLITVATCSLNNWALDLKGNKERIITASRQAKSKGAGLLITPELSITGYGCLDHFLELDLYEQCWEVLQDIMDHPDCQDIILHVGMPVEHDSCYYNCCIVIHNRKIVLIRPKLSLANDGNFREMRYFTPWPRKSPAALDIHYLPAALAKFTGQESVPFGDALLRTPDTVIGIESCEELFAPDSPNIDMGLQGAEIFTNSSGSHHQLRKLDERISLILGPMAKSFGLYMYSNQQGCDGDRLYYDGCALIVMNGKIVAQGTQFSLNDVEVITATVDLAEIRSFRFRVSRRLQSEPAPKYQRLEVKKHLVQRGYHADPRVKISPPLEPRIHKPEEEIALGPACWLWDYLRRSRQGGFFVPLSGGIDSCSTATIVFSMCREVFKAVGESNEQVIKDMCRICGEDESWRPKTPQDICSRLFSTAYMGTKAASSPETRSRAKNLAKAIGAYHTDMNIDTLVSAITTLFTSTFGVSLRFRVHGGTYEENIALQNIQARLRMVLAYLFAQTIPYVRGRKGPGLLVLGSGNVDECLRGYLTKYDCSSADLNPIGAISKIDLKRFIKWAETEFDLPVLKDFLEATPTAELEPITDSYVQSDEADMGITYEELSIFGRLRKSERLGPWGQWNRLLHMWGDKFSPWQIYEKVVHFNKYCECKVICLMDATRRLTVSIDGINRHKMTTMYVAITNVE